MRLAIIALLLSSATTPALAESGDGALPSRVDRLEHEMRAVQRKVFPGANPDYFEPQITAPAATAPEAGTPASSAVSDLTQRVSALEQQVQQLTGQTEENGHRLTVLEQQFAKMKGDTDYRLNTLEGHGAPAPDGGAAPAAAGDAAGSPPPFGPAGRKPVKGTPAPVKADETKTPAPAPARPAADAAPAAAMPAVAKTGDAAEDQYMLGYTLWTQHRYAEAETQLRTVADKYPKHRRASYAQNLLGRAYLDDGQLSDAARTFYASYKQFPRGERAPDSLYYLGQTLHRLKKDKDACEAYGEFQDVYGATANTTLKARVEQGRADAQCGG